MVKAVTFDLHGVYFINGKKNFINNLGKLGVSEKEAVRVFLKSDEMNKRYKCGEMGDEEYWSWAIKEWGVKLSINEVVDLLIRGYEVNEEVVEVVKLARKKGYKTLVCSNNFPARIRGLNKRFGFLDDFDATVFSYEMRVTKPDKKIFEKLVELSGVKPSEIVFADDNKGKLQGAKEIGIKTFVYESFEQFLGELKKLGVNL